MEKIKLLIKLFICFIAMLLTIYFIYEYYNDKKIDTTLEYTMSEKKNELDMISNLKEQYNNNDIKAFLEIPSVLSLPIVQNDDNEYYLNHNLYQETVKAGTPFLDYRINSLEERKLLIYGHNSTYRTLPFTSLLNYQDKKFFTKHPEIYLYTENGKKTYKIFSVYIEDEDFDYVNLKNFNGLTFYEHILKLEDKSLYDTGVILNENSNILILQTCSFDNTESGSNYLLVMGVLQ